MARPHHGSAVPALRHRSLHVDHGIKEAVMSESSRILSQRFEDNRRYTFGVVVLSQGKRLDDLNRGFESLLAQKGVDLDIVCVGNGWEQEGIPDQVKTMGVQENIVITAGRNA